MNVNINVKRRYKINGKEYDSIEDMPEDLRDMFKKASGLKMGTANQINQVGIWTKIVLNGKEYESIDAMPQDDRKLYEKVLEVAATGTAPPEIVTAAITNSILTKPQTSTTGHIGKSPNPPKIEPSSRKLIIFIALGALILLLYIWMQGK